MRSAEQHYRKSGWEAGSFLEASAFQNYALGKPKIDKLRMLIINDPQTAMANVLRAQYFVSEVTAFPGIAMAWASRFAGQPHPFVCIQTPPAMPAPGAALIADFWIYAD